MSGPEVPVLVFWELPLACEACSLFKDVKDAPKELLLCRDEVSDSCSLLLKLCEHIRSDQKWSGEIKKPGEENGPIVQLKSALEELQAIVEEPGDNKHGARALMLLEPTGFGHWVNGKHPALFGHGMPGASKTIMAAMVIEHLVHKIMTSSVISESAFTASTVHGRCPTV